MSTTVRVAAPAEHPREQRVLRTIPAGGESPRRAPSRLSASVSNAAALVVALIVLAACSNAGAPAPEAQGSNAPASTRVSGGVLTDLGSIEELRAQFAQDDGSARLVLLLSPT